MCRGEGGTSSCNPTVISKVGDTPRHSFNLIPNSRIMNATLINPFKVYVPSERDVVAVVGDLIPGGTLKFIPRTIAKFKTEVNKAIGVILTNAEGESTTLPCSKAVSRSIVDAMEDGTVTKSGALAIIAGLQITEFTHNKTNEVCQVISAPVGEGSDEEELTITKANLAKNKVTYEDLI